MSRPLHEASHAIKRFVATLAPDALALGDAATFFEIVAGIEKSCAAAKTLLAPRIEADAEWRRAGMRSAEEWMARTSGTTTGAARELLDTGKRLGDAPATAAALRHGELSQQQANAIAEAAAADPHSEGALIEIAKKRSLKKLRDETREVVLGSKYDLEERHKRQHSQRSVRRWTDPDGMGCGSWRLPPEMAARFNAALDAETDAQFRQGQRDGRRDTREQYGADALVAMAAGNGLAGRRSGPDVTIHVLVSMEALRRGSVEGDEVSLVVGGGPIPPSLVSDLLPDAFLTGVLIDGTDILKVRRFGRYRPKDVETALLVRTVLQRGDVQCDVDDCDRGDIEWDHTREVGRGGMTCEDNLRPLCRFHHREKTAGRLQRAGDSWVRAGPAP